MSAARDLAANLFDASPLAMSVLTLSEGRFLDVNVSFLRQTGYERADVVGRTAAALELWPVETERRRLAEALQARRPVRELELTLRVKSGERREVLAYFEFALQAGEPCALGMFLDITERKRVEGALRASEQRYQLIALATADAVWDWDLVANTVQWNHGLRTLFGYPADTIREHNWWMEHVHPDDIAATEAGVQAAIRSGQPFWSGEYRYRRADGSYAHVVDRGYVIHSEAGQPVRMIGAMVDITDRVRLVEAQARAALEERQRLARDLHDSVTQSLYSLTLLAEAARRLLGTGQTPQAREYVARLGETAQQSLKEMRLLVYELRPAELEQAGLAGALQQRLDAVEKRAGVRAGLRVDGDLDLPGPVEETLYRIAQEALNNALKHAAATTVTVTLRAEARQVTLEIADDGRGFDLAAIQDRGGLGLRSMRERAAELGAALQIQAQPGAGTRLQVTLTRPAKEGYV